MEIDKILKDPNALMKLLEKLGCTPEHGGCVPLRTLYKIANFFENNSILKQKDFSRLWEEATIEYDNSDKAN